MSTRWLTHVRKHSRAKGSAKFLLFALADYANDEGVCWPSVATLADYITVSERQCQRLLTQLEELGELVVERGAGRSHASIYRLKGDTHVTDSDNAEAVKGDTHVTDSEEKVTSMTLKGDTHVTRSVKNRTAVVASSPVPAPPAPPAETAPAAATEPKAPEPRDPWIADYETIWGMVVPSPYVAAQIDEWKARVPQSTWQHALQESLKANARNWRYLGRILERLERDGPPTPVTVPTPGPDLSFSLENLQ
jgi:hypothetical protein